MPDRPYIAEIAALIGDPARANMLTALKHGSAMTAAGLAEVAGVAPNTASDHLRQLRLAGLIAFVQEGRHRYYRIARPDVADVLEALESMAARVTPRRAPRGSRQNAIRAARTCYDHLAGELGVVVTNALLQNGAIRRGPAGFVLTGSGRRYFIDFGVPVSTLERGRRAVLRTCFDWSENAAHLGGALGAAMHRRFCDLGWLTSDAESRSVTVTPRGRRAFRDRLGIAV